MLHRTRMLHVCVMRSPTRVCARAGTLQRGVLQTGKLVGGGASRLTGHCTLLADKPYPRGKIQLTRMTPQGAVLHGASRWSPACRERHSTAHTFPALGRRNNNNSLPHRNALAGLRRSRGPRCSRLLLRSGRARVYGALMRNGSVARTAPAAHSFKLMSST